MRFVCFGHFDERKWAAKSEAEREALLEEAFAYDDVLRKAGHIVGGAALESPSKTSTLRLKDGKVIVTDGPFAETKEQVGGLVIFEAKDQKEAIELMSKHPGLRGGPFEIRPEDESITAMYEARKKRS